MANESLWSWKEVVAIIALSLISLLILIHDGSPKWLRAIVVFLATVGPMLPVLGMIPWHFVAKYQGLASRSAIPCNVSCTHDTLTIEHGNKRTSHSLERIVRARLARNDNWTESRMLEDALGLFAANGREIARIPESAVGFASIMEELAARKIPIEDVDVSAPTFLD